MMDLFLRIAHRPFDYIRAFQTHTLVLKKQIAEGNNVYSFIFEPTKPLRWKAGQHAIFRMPNKQITGKNWRAFSIASAPCENEIRITTIIKDSPSSFKNALKSLTFGNSIIMNGPFGEFYISKETSIFGIANGVGITPFRSILKNLVNGGLPNTHVHLLYSSKDSTHTFKAELETFSTHPQVTIEFFYSEGSALEVLNQTILARKSGSTYYISGSPRFINDTRCFLKKHNVRKIVNDSFQGY